jgi:hypothetical protein
MLPRIGWIRNLVVGLVAAVALAALAPGASASTCCVQCSCVQLCCSDDGCPTPSAAICGGGGCTRICGGWETTWSCSQLCAGD